MNDALRRAIRTAIQSFLGSVLTSGILSAASTDGVVDTSTLGKVGVSALAAGLIAAISYVQNTLEDHDVVPALMKPERRRQPLKATEKRPTP